MWKIIRFTELLLTKLFIAMVSIYRCFSVAASPRCIFYPSCSCYALEAMRIYGGFWGFYLVIKRLLRCHPWGVGGVDCVPEFEIADPGINNG